MTIYYSPATRPADEDDRQRAVDESGFLQAKDDPILSGIVHRAAELFGTPMAAISIVDHDRQYFPAEVGLDASEAPRVTAFCTHTILDCGRPLCITDATADARFAGNPIVLSGLEIRFYTGVPLTGAGGQPLGALCVIDSQVRAQPSPEALDALAALALQAQARATELNAQ